MMTKGSHTIMNAEKDHCRSRGAVPNDPQARTNGQDGFAVCVWRDLKEIIHCKPLPSGQTLNLKRLLRVIDQMKAGDRPEVARIREFREKNARPRTSLTMRHAIVTC